MATYNGSKLKTLLERHKPGTIYLAYWLDEQGISRDLQQHYLKSGWLEPVGRGAFKRPGDEVNWQCGLHALVEQANLDVHVGGITALSARGIGQYLRLGRDKVCLFSVLGVSLPAWFRKHDWGVNIEHIRTGFLPTSVGLGAALLVPLNSGDSTASRIQSTSERAILECLFMTPNKQDLIECYELMEGLANLRPEIVQQLLEACTSVKVKRLFLYMAEKAGHQWLQFVDQSNINVGKGDRLIGQNGVYVAKHHITLPKELVLL